MIYLFVGIACFITGMIFGTIMENRFQRARVTKICNEEKEKIQKLIEKRQQEQNGKNNNNM